MKIKKFTASTMPEAMKKIRAELGSDAVILNSRVFQSGGFLGFFRKSNIEVIAAIDPETEASSKPPMQIKPQSETYSKVPLKANEHKERIDASSFVSAADSNDILKEITQLKEILSNKDAHVPIHLSLPGPISRQIEHFRDQEIDSAIIEELTAFLLEKWYLGGASANEVDIRKWSVQAISLKLAGQSFGGMTFEKKFVNVIGPTGVGKTTTLAKIAADSVLKHKKKVAFITTDTYRIAAIEQLKTYAKILDVPIEVCYNIDDFRQASDKFADFDHVFIDTAGRNFRNKKYVNDLKTAIDFDNDMETYLVLAVTSKQRDMVEIRKQFSLISIDKFIFTKVDETAVYGAMLNMAEKFSAGIAYITNGQDVPDDLIEANPEVIANTILGVARHE
ncbi:MAG TPA: flagellar biosynthesis protein FlhF [Bacillus bacterium]|nr:flagellar biosynthesis protein FlhF [Bacillus sp. (in: firmicutes)]